MVRSPSVLDRVKAIVVMMVDYPTWPHWQKDLLTSIWSFATGGALVIAFIFLCVGFQSLSKSQSLWDIDVTDVMLILIGAGLSTGCFAVIGNYLIRSLRNDLPLHHKADI